MTARPHSGAIERKLRELVESAGFELAVSLDQAGMFRVTTKDLDPVASAAVTSTGFRVFFPAQQLQVSTPSTLVDALEAWKGAKS